MNRKVKRYNRKESKIETEKIKITNHDDNLHE